MKFVLTNYPQLLQNNYLGRNDCTLTSITSVYMYYLNSKDDIGIRKTVEDQAKKFFYTEKIGTIPVFIQTILFLLNKKFLIDKKSKVIYSKFLYNFETIQKILNNNNPIILSMLNGNNYYISHTVTIIGYEIKDNKNYLILQDNWKEEKQYLDFNKISKISCINWLEEK